MQNKENDVATSILTDEQKRAIDVVVEIAKSLPKSVLITDSICKKATTDNLQNSIKLVALPGKDIQFVTTKTKSNDNYRTRQFYNIILHLGTVDVLNQLQSDAQLEHECIIKKYEILVDLIQRLNVHAKIFISALIPIVNKKYLERGAENFIRKVNDGLKVIATRKANTLFMKTFKLFIQDGAPAIDRYKPDGVHPRVDQYIRLVKFFGQVKSSKTTGDRRKKLLKFKAY